MAEANGAEVQTVDSRPAEPPRPPSEQVIRAVEALIFASTEPVSARTILGLLESRAMIPEAVQDVGAYVRETLVALVARYDGRGVAPVEVAGGWQFRTAPDLAPMLTKVLAKPRRLQRGTMETLAIIAYHQPCTRAEIEEIRGVSLGQTVLDTLIEESLIAPRGRKEVPGRPVLWGTTADFLRHFGLTSLTALPRREELLGDMPTSPRLPVTHNAQQSSADLLTHGTESSEESSSPEEEDMGGRSVPDDDTRKPSEGDAGASEALSDDED
nr:SMC-Scp complex subunit ScpB [Acetobacter sacchari]